MTIYLNWLWLDKLRLQIHCLINNHKINKALAFGQIEVWCKQCNHTYYFLEVNK